MVATKSNAFRQCLSSLFLWYLYIFIFGSLTAIQLYKGSIDCTSDVFRKKSWVVQRHASSCVYFKVTYSHSLLISIPTNSGVVQAAADFSHVSWHKKIVAVARGSLPHPRVFW